MENLQEKINLADTNRRTYLGLLFKTTEDVTLAKELRVQAEEFVEKCDFDSGKSIEDTKRQLALLKGKLKP